MKKYILLNLFLFLLPYFSYSQDVQLSENYIITEGEEYEKISNNYKKYYSWENQSYILNKTLKGFIIQKIDPVSLKEINQTKLKKVFNYVREEIEQLIQFDNKIFVFVSSRVKKNEKLEVFSVSLKDLKVSERKTLISSSKNLLEAEERNDYQVRTKYNFKKANNKRLIIEYVEQDIKSNLVINIFDKTLNAINKYNIDIKNNKSISLIDRYADDNGNYYFLGQIFTPKLRLNKKKLEEYDLMLYKVSENSDDIVREQLELDKARVIDEAKLHLTSNGSLKVIGTLRNYGAKDGLLIGKRKGEPTGLFILSMDDKLQITNHSYHKFPIKMLEKNLRASETKKIKKKDEAKKFDSYFKNLKVKINENDDKNETIIIGEQQFITIEKVKNIYYERSHFNNILAAKLFEDGSLKWMHKLIKFQRGRYGKSDMSFNNLTYRGKHYIFFRDNEKNFGVKQEEIDYTYAYGRGGILVAYVIDDKFGKVTKDIVYYPEGRTSFEFISSTSENGVIYEQFLKKKNRLVKISIKP